MLRVKRRRAGFFGIMKKMKLGYPCINRSVGCTANSTFRLASYTKKRFRETVRNNLECLSRILEYNRQHVLLFFRISSDLIPFASHPVCDVNWQKEFKEDFADIGGFIRQCGMRISMHPDQFVLINSPRADVHRRSVAELRYHADVLDGLGLDDTAKIQIHVGGLYGDRQKAMERFVKRYRKLPEAIKNRLVIENDDRLFPLKDCMAISRQTGIPVLFDTFHHSLLNHRETIEAGLLKASTTWKKKDGLLMVDYSSQQKGHRPGTHAHHIDLKDFRTFVTSVKEVDFDIMLEIKDKEKSALPAIRLIKNVK